MIKSGNILIISALVICPSGAVTSGFYISIVIMTLVIRSIQCSLHQCTSTMYEVYKLDFILSVLISSSS